MAPFGIVAIFYSDWILAAVDGNWAGRPSSIMRYGIGYVLLQSHYRCSQCEPDGVRRLGIEICS
ncbi:hypothetical protein BGZ60DRAFT_396204 [Tricladium varicosporioides]|nr:hypothetical protein BGZ60DRAFT_396204 [Hymenoscyphus varicosporioides]